MRFFYVALINQRDAWHSRVAAYARSHDDEIVTTEWVLTEVADALAASRARVRVQAAFQTLTADPTTRVIGASSKLFVRGLELYHQRPDKDWSLTDCISFVVMADEGLREALTGDRHFAQAGYVPVFAEGL